MPDEKCKLDRLIRLQSLTRGGLSVGNFLIDVVELTSFRHKFPRSFSDGPWDLSNGEFFPSLDQLSVTRPKQFQSFLPGTSTSTK
jgi:hypothetical protein